MQETCEAMREWDNKFKVLKEKKKSPIKSISEKSFLGK